MEFVLVHDLSFDHVDRDGHVFIFLHGYAAIEIFHTHVHNSDLRTKNQAISVVLRSTIGVLILLDNLIRFSPP